MLFTTLYDLSTHFSITITIRYTLNSGNHSTPDLHL